MTAPLMVNVAGHLVGAGFAVLRFNFRGVGESGGTWSNGVGEVDDIAAAVDAAVTEHPDLPLGIAGWSFGAATSLRWQARERSTLHYAGIAPPVSSDLTPPLPRPHELAPARRTFILGDRDQFVTVGDLEQYAASVGGELQVMRGSDHFFYFREERVAALVAEALRQP
jgi:alpha/beta superfamily hydrolase